MNVFTNVGEQERKKEYEEHREKGKSDYQSTVNAENGVLKRCRLLTADFNGDDDDLMEDYE